VGCLGSIVGVVVLVALVVAVAFVGLIVLGIVAALVVVGLLALAVDRIALALSPKRRERRANRPGIFVWQFGQAQPGPVIDTTATEHIDVVDDRAIDATATEHEPGRDEPAAG
jgi:hypothetical protein